MHEGVKAFAALDPEQEVFPGLTAGDLVFSMTPGPVEHLRTGMASYLPDGDPMHTLHWYAPAERAAYPAVLFIHSGSWVAGDAGQYLRYASDLAGRGYVTASINYRLVPQVQWPDPFHDVCAAAAWLGADPLGIGVRRRSVVISGGSAGGHLAAMAALAPFETVLSREEIAGAVLWYPPLRLKTMAAIPEGAGAVQALLGELSEAKLEDASPINRVTTRSPPILTMTGSRDPVCTEADARAFHGALTEAGVRNELEIFPDGPHGFDLTRRWYQGSFERMLVFVQSLSSSQARSSGGSKRAD